MADNGHLKGRVGEESNCAIDGRDDPFLPVAKRTTSKKSQQHPVNASNHMQISPMEQLHHYGNLE
jgi:hypothetical protein